MKIRSGFVSNSSSSSFVLLTTKENHERVLKELDNPYVTKVVEFVMQETKFLGRDCIYVQTFSDNGGYDTFMDFSYEPEDEDIDIDDIKDDEDEDIDDENDDIELDPNEAFDLYVEEIQKNEAEVFSSVEDW